jgi:glutamate N-acetyltransferase/amino-acid N-acetyltransferase
LTISIVSTGGVCVPSGFKAAGVTAGLKASGKPDLAIIVSDREASVAGMFTTNTVPSPTVLVSRERSERGVARGVVVNSGCANAWTGRRGYQDALAMAAEAAQAVGFQEEEMLVCSTGHIGSFLPMDLVKSGIKEAAGSLSADDEPAMRAIMTTDTKPKRSAISHSEGWKVGGICKGAGMIAPDMATMLAFVTTDAMVEPQVLRKVLNEVVATTFNAITIDGDRSTNDTVLAFANGASGVEPAPDEFARALHMVCRSLAEQIVSDGEGATKFVTVRVRGAKDEGEAKKAVRTVAESLLVKTALFGNDPNWGRIAAALGKSGVELDTNKLTISMNAVELLSEGVPAAEETLLRMRGSLRHEPEITIVCDLFRGNAVAEMLTTDLSTRYVELNAEYET